MPPEWRKTSNDRINEKRKRSHRTVSPVKMLLSYCLLNRGSRLGAYVTSGTSAAYESSSGVNFKNKLEINTY